MCLKLPLYVLFVISATSYHAFVFVEFLVFFLSSFFCFSVVRIYHFLSQSLFYRSSLLYSTIFHSCFLLCPKWMKRAKKSLHRFCSMYAFRIAVDVFEIVSLRVQCFFFISFLILLNSALSFSSILHLAAQFLFLCSGALDKYHTTVEIFSYQENEKCEVIDNRCGCICEQQQNMLSLSSCLCYTRKFKSVFLDLSGLALVVLGNNYEKRTNYVYIVFQNFFRNLMIPE